MTNVVLSLTLMVSLLAFQQTEDTAPQERPRFSASVTEIIIYASVYDSQSKLVSNLTRDDFEVLEDRQPQRIDTFILTDVPSTLGLVLDASGSMRNKQSIVEEAVELFLDLTNPRHELFLIAFDDQVELEEDFTRDVEDIRDSVRNIIVKGGTALYDATFLAIDKAEQGHEPKKVAVIFTDGEDKDSYYEYEEVLEKARESETQIFIVAFLNQDLSDDAGFFGIGRSDRQKVVRAVQDLVDVTGGKAFFPEETGELKGVFEDIATELKNQYRISYQSTNTEFDGSWRRIDVKVKNARERAFKVRARKGYYARSGASGTSGR